MNVYLVTFIGNWKAKVAGRSYAHAHYMASKISVVTKMICIVDRERSL